MKVKEGHSSFADWIPILSCVVVIFTPILVSLFAPEVAEWGSFIDWIHRHARAISGCGVIGFLIVMLWHSFCAFDEIAEKTSYKRADGMWIRLSDRHSGITKVDGMRLESEFNQGAWNHSSKGHYDPKSKKFIIKVIRERPNHTDRAVLLGTLEVLNEDTLKCHIHTSDGGHRDVPVGFTEISYFERVRDSGALPIPPAIINLMVNAPARPPS